MELSEEVEGIGWRNAFLINEVFEENDTCHAKFMIIPMQFAKDRIHCVQNILHVFGQKAYRQKPSSYFYDK